LLITAHTLKPIFIPVFGLLWPLKYIFATCVEFCIEQDHFYWPLRQSPVLLHLSSCVASGRGYRRRRL
jgi:hypothetical protein